MSVHLQGIHFRAKGGVVLNPFIPEDEIPFGPLLYSVTYEAHIVDSNWPDESRPYCHLAICEEDGTETIIKPDGFHSQGYAVWNRDYTKIAYSRVPSLTTSAFSWGYEDGAEFCLINPDGSGEEVIFDGFVEGASFSPDGQRIAIAHSPTSNHYNPNFYVMDLDGTNLVNGPEFPFHRIPSWTADGQWIVYIESVSSTEQYIKMWNPTTDETKIIWDVAEYAADNDLDMNFPFSFGIVNSIDVNHNNIAVFGVENKVDSGEDIFGATLYHQQNQTLGFIECVEGATPTFINAQDLPMYDWPVYRDTGTSYQYSPTSPSSQSISDNFDRADGSPGANWEDSGTLTIVSNTLRPSSVPAYGRWIGSGPFADADVLIKVSTVGGNSDNYAIGLRVDPVTFDGMWLVLGNTTFTGFRNVTIIKRESGVDTVVATPGLRSVGPANPVFFRIAGPTMSAGTTATTWFNGSSSLCPFTSGYGAVRWTARSTSVLDDFRFGQVTVTSDSWDFQNYKLLDQTFWSKSGEYVMWHHEIPDAPFSHREWQSTIMNAEDPEDWWLFKYYPGDETSDPSVAHNVDIDERDTIPAGAKNFYVPTWASFSTKEGIVANAGYSELEYPDGQDVGDRVDTTGFMHLVMKERSQPADWIADTEYPSGYNEFTLDGPPMGTQSELEDDFNRSDSGDLGASYFGYEVDRIGITSNQASGKGQERYDADTARNWGEASVEISGLASIIYEIIYCDHTKNDKLAGAGAYYDHSIPQIGFVQRPYSGSPTYVPVSSQSLSVGDAIGVRIGDSDIWFFYRKDGVWFGTGTAAYATLFGYGFPDLFEPSKPAIVMSADGGSLDNLYSGAWSYAPFIEQRMLVTGIHVCTWYEDQQIA